MKRAILPNKHTAFVILTVVALGALWFGCEDTPTDEENVDTGPITVTAIILNPKSPQPGDTIQVTVVLSSSSLNSGDYPQITWSAQAGTFLENNQLSVRWIAPASSQVVEISVTAKNSINQSSGTSTVFVGIPSRLVARDAGQMWFNAVDTTVYYLHSSLAPGDDGFTGYTMYNSFGGGVAVAPGSSPGFAFTFRNDLSLAAHNRVEPGLPSDALPAVNVYIVDPGAGTQTAITTDGKPTEQRHDEFLAPRFSPNGNLVTYEAFRTGIGADIDTFDVSVYNLTSDQETVATGTHGGFHRNFWPSISSDGAWLVFISDRNALNVWEYYGLPITGDVVATDSTSTVRLSDTGGLIASGIPPTVTNPMKAWNPSPADPILASVGADGTLRLIATNAGGATTVSADGIPSTPPLREIVWSADGQVLAVSSGVALYTVTKAGGVTLRHTPQPGDQLRDVAWSPNGEFVVYRITRAGSDSWFELLDIDAGSGFTAPVVMTATAPAGDINDFRALMSMAPVYTSSNVLYLLIFNPTGTTPNITTLDITGALP